MSGTLSTISRGISGSFGTTAASDESLASSNKQAGSQQWQQIVDHKLIEWAIAPQRFEDGYFIAPTSDSVRNAFELVHLLRSETFDVPQRVAANGNGGIA